MRKMNSCQIFFLLTVHVKFSREKKLLKYIMQKFQIKILYHHSNHMLNPPPLPCSASLNNLDTFKHTLEDKILQITVDLILRKQLERSFPLLPWSTRYMYIQSMIN